MLISLSACMTQPTPAPVSSPASPPPPAAIPSLGTSIRPETDLALHVARIRALNAPQLSAELSANRQRAKDAPSYENRLRLALTLWASGGEEQEIQALAESPQNGNEDGQLRGIGMLLTAIIVERRRNRELQVSTQTRSRESKREQEIQQARLDALKRQIEDLERKLAAMRDMEKSLQQRP